MLVNAVVSGKILPPGVEFIETTPVSCIAFPDFNTDLDGGRIPDYLFFIVQSFELSGFFLNYITCQDCFWFVYLYHFHFDLLFFSE
jgi:hypothetical protein